MADKKKLQPITFQNCRIAFRNFSGKAGTYNAEGDRNFHLMLDETVAKDMLDDGWNVKFLKPREDGDAPQPHIQVTVSYRNRPPRIVMITSRGKTALDEDMISLLDWAQIINVDLILNPFEWEVGGRGGIKAYLASLYVTIQEDELEAKYADVPDSGQSAMIVQSEVIYDDPKAVTTGRRAIDAGTPF